MRNLAKLCLYFIPKGVYAYTKDEMIIIL